MAAQAEDITTNHERAKDTITNALDTKIRLKRQLGWVGATAFVLGSCIGSGIFVTPSSIFRNSGSVGMALLIWSLSGAISIMGGLCYAELAAVLPACGGDYAYVMAAGKHLGRAGDLTAFMCAWSFVLLSDPLGCATQGVTFSTYALSVVYKDCSPPYAVSAMVGVVFTCLGTALNCISNKSSAWAQEMLSAIKCLILLSIVITAAVYFANGGSQLQPPLFSTHVTTTGIVDAFYGALLSFSGWKYINIVAEEMRDPAKDLQRALMAGVLFTTFIYILVNLSYAVVLDFGILTSTEAIASAFAQKTWGDIAYSAVPIAVSISVFGMLCSSFFTAPRLTLAAARRGHMPRFLSLVTIESHIPLTCVFCKGLLSVIFLFFGTLEVLIQASVFVETLWDAIVVLSLLVLRFTMKDRGASYKAPLVVVLLKLVSSVALVIIPLVEHVNYYQYVIILGVHVVGALYYGVFVTAGLDCRASHMVAHFFQKFLLSAPCLDELAFMLQESECPELNTLTAQGDANTQSYGSLMPSGSVLTAIYARRDSPSLSKRHRYRDTSARAADTPVQIGGTCASGSSISSRF